MLFKLRSMVMLVAIMFMIVGCGGGGGDDSVTTPADYTGTYKGTFSGEDSGTWEAIVNTDGKFTGTITSSQVGTFSLIGTVSRTGKLDAVIGENSNGSTFIGTIDSEGNVNGTWSNPGQNQSGIFTGTKTGGDTPGTTPIGNLTGTWSVTDKVDARACDEGIYNNHYTLDVIAQSENSITFTAKTGTYTGTLNGNKLTGSGSYPEDGGTTQTSVSLTVASDCNTMTGTSTWTWSDGTETCSGTSEVSAIRDNPVGCGTGTGGPNAPSGLTATTTSESSISLIWSDNADDEDNYVVQRSTTSGSGFTTIATLGANNTSYDDHTGLTASTMYYYRVYATNSVGDSDYSNEVSATTADTVAGAPIAPSGLSVRATSSATIDLSWTDASSDESGFRIERSTSSTTGFTAVANMAANVTSYMDSFGLSASTTYYYRMVSTNSVGDSVFSNTANATTLVLNATPEVPTDLSATATSTSSISLDWIDASDNETGFRIERSLILGNEFVQIGTVSADVTTYVDNSLAAATTYYYRVAATNSAGSSAYSNRAVAITDGTATSAPILTLISNESGEITLEWIYDGWGLFGDTSEGYQLEESTTSASSGFSLIYSTIHSGGDRESPKSYSIIRSAGTYYYRVRALKLGTYTAYSNVLAVSVTSDPITQTFYPALANTVIYNSYASNRADSYYQNQIAVGCNWIGTWYDELYIVNVICFGSLLWFDIDPVISGKTINSAILILYPELLAPSRDTLYRLRANASNWSSTVTWNYVATNMSYYIGSDILFDQPVTSTIPQEIDVTAIVQNWADGSWGNYGFQMFDAIMTGGSSDVCYRSTDYISNETTNGTFRPQLKVNYQ